jgi:hypothetical protein
VFDQNYGSKDTRWLYWFMGVMVVYALLTFFPETEALAGKVGTFLIVVGAFLFHRAIVRWLRGLVKK